MGKPKRVGFTLGDHTFVHPSVTAPLDRIGAPKKLIRGALPPTYLDGIARESGASSRAAKALFVGKFCGHGEPTMAVFDIVIDGEEVLEVAADIDPKHSTPTESYPLVLARKPNSKTWRVLFRRQWAERQNGLIDVVQRAPTAKELSRLSLGTITGRVSIGFEYPPDAESRDSVSWLTIDALPQRGRKPMCLVNEEMS